VDTTKKLYGHRTDQGTIDEQRELIVRVSWDHTEPNGAGNLRVAQRVVETGLTIAIRWDTKTVLAVQRGEVTRRGAGESRDALINRLVECEALTVERAGSVSRASARIPKATVADGTARMSGGGKVLHLVSVNDE
jgi:hypothetical protein